MNWTSAYRFCKQPTLPINLSVPAISVGITSRIKVRGNINVHYSFIAFNFNKMFIVKNDIKPGLKASIEIDVVDKKPTDRIRITFGQGRATVSNNGSSGVSCRIVMPIWEGLVEKATRVRLTPDQYEWDEDKRALTFSLPATMLKTKEEES